MADFKAVLANGWWINVSKGSTTYAQEVPKEEIAYWYYLGWRDVYIGNQHEDLMNALESERTGQHNASSSTVIGSTMTWAPPADDVVR